MPTARKTEMLEEVTDRMARASVAISADFRGLSVAQMTELRRVLRRAGAEVRVVKNTIAARAAAAAERPEMASLLAGPTALTFGFDDPIDPIKAFTEHVRQRRLQVAINGGWLEGRLLGRDDLDAVARLPSREQLIADVVAKLQGPLYNLAGLLQASMRNLAGLIEARAAQLEETAA